ncbi:MAG: hypothetical protein ACO3NL_09345, partial [Phycisphaerales bacterium]
MPSSLTRSRGSLTAIAMLCVAVEAFAVRHQAVQTRPAVPAQRLVPAQPIVPAQRLVPAQPIAPPPPS